MKAPQILHDSPQTIASVNPATGELLTEFEPHSREAIEDTLQRSVDAFRRHRRFSYETRATLMIRAAEILESATNDLALIITREMGKPIRAAVAEIKKCALGCRYFAANAERFLADETVPGQESRNYIRYQPLGVILAIMPWNFPFWQVFRFAAPALMAGNVAVLKHASNVPQCALAIEDVFRRAGFAEGVFQTALIGSDRVHELIEDDRVSAVTLTGSVGAGSHVAAVAGRKIKKTVLELGGSDPFIVMSSANLDRAIATAVRARTVNSGQSCIAAKRFIIEESVADEFEHRFVQALAALKVGDPMDETTDIGPLATSGILISVEQQVNRTVQMGGNVLLGGGRLPPPGYFFRTTALRDVPSDSPAAREEIFGPVAALFRCRGIDDAIRIANDTSFGLGSCIWTEDDREQRLFADEIEAGLAFINGMVASSPSLPFGGIKQSGYGRELASHGIREFVNIKTVSINKHGRENSGIE
jgi:succinate-semialdehyde dehydrogenase/glutarate-semialdehyde dehydrogenase